MELADAAASPARNFSFEYTIHRPEIILKTEISVLSMLFTNQKLYSKLKFLAGKISCCCSSKLHRPEISVLCSCPKDLYFIIDRFPG